VLIHTTSTPSAPWRAVRSLPSAGVMPESWISKATRRECAAETASTSARQPPVSPSVGSASSCASHPAARTMSATLFLSSRCSAVSPALGHVGDAASWAKKRSRRDLGVHRCPAAPTRQCRARPGPVQRLPGTIRTRGGVHQPDRAERGQRHEIDSVRDAINRT
jgi:hypothetical protein